MIKSILIDVGTPLHDAERRLILATLHHCFGCRAKTAKALQISERQLYNKILEYQCSECRHNPCRDEGGLCSITGEMCPRRYDDVRHGVRANPTGRTKNTSA